MGAISLILAFICVQASLQNIQIKASPEVSPLEIPAGELVNKVSDYSSSEELTVEKRDIPFDIDEGSGALVHGRRNNMRGYMAAKKPSNNNNSDFIFENENTNETNEENAKDQTSTTAQVTTSSTKTDITTTTPQPPSPSPTSTSTTPKEPTKVPLPSCHGISCENHSAIIQPNHVTNEIGSTFELKCLLDDKMGNATLPDNWKIEWTIERYQIPPVNEYKPTLSITNATVLDSGIYACLLKSADGCCFHKIFILVNIYQKPDYALHLLITGAICGIQLLVCIPFMIYRRRKVYAYSKMDENEVDDEQKLIA